MTDMTMTEHLAASCAWQAEAGYPAPRPLLATWTWNYPTGYVRDTQAERETEQRLDDRLQSWLPDDLEYLEDLEGLPGPMEPPAVRVTVTVRLVPGYETPRVSDEVEMPDDWPDDTREQVEIDLLDAVHPRCTPLLPGRPLLGPPTLGCSGPPPSESAEGGQR